MKDHLIKDYPDKRPLMKDHLNKSTLIKALWGESTLISTVRREHPDERAPWWQSTLKRDHCAVKEGKNLGIDVTRPLQKQRSAEFISKKAQCILTHSFAWAPFSAVVYCKVQTGLNRHRYFSFSLQNEKPEFMLFDRVLADVPCR